MCNLVPSFFHKEENNRYFRNVATYTILKFVELHKNIDILAHRQNKFASIT